MHTTNPPVYRTLDEIKQLVEAFENGTLTAQQFNHHAHMTVGMWYLWQMPYPQAVERMRKSILHFAQAHHHGQLYHETITLFWMRLLRHVLDNSGGDKPLPDVMVHTLEGFGNMQVIFRHYSRELLFSEQARREWVEPDLIPLPYGGSEQ